MIVTYVLSIVGVFITVKIVDALAPTFSGQKNSLNALKLVAYSWTATWVVGVVQIIPGLSILTILGLYSLYLLYLGLPHLMECPADKTLVYTVVIVVVAFVVMMVVGAVTVAIVGVSMIGSYY